MSVGSTITVPPDQCLMKELNPDLNFRKRSNILMFDHKQQLIIFKQLLLVNYVTHDEWVERVINIVDALV